MKMKIYLDGLQKPSMITLLVAGGILYYRGERIDQIAIIKILYLSDSVGISGMQQHYIFPHLQTI